MANDDLMKINDYNRLYAENNWPAFDTNLIEMFKEHLNDEDRAAFDNIMHSLLRFRCGLITEKLDFGPYRNAGYFLDKLKDLAGLPPAPYVVRYSALKLKRLLQDAGLWETVEKELSENNALIDLFLGGGVIRADDPAFVAMLAKLQPLLGNQLDAGTFFDAIKL